MQNKGYIEAITDARLFADFMGSTIEKVEQIVRTANAKQQRINGEYQQLERQLQSTKSSADRLCSAEKRRRDNAARHAVEHMKVALSDIKDPHFTGWSPDISGNVAEVLMFRREIIHRL